MKCTTKGCDGSIVILKAFHLVRCECLKCGTVYMVTDRASWDEELEKVMSEVEPED
jgi:hypothetical protein